ncbi:glutathione S-transferase C-terminal domain-containing protein [Streptomyces nanshensis]|uniref:Glutathione S-transferase n=1 Tax=Streptomyces nanshensis TaxID=518642 RepID=A0A1E7KXU7_9ACTN|nr:glutathione S-transferase C-terminal domain-containing protein [Streptomyces nanshensis]OEV08724.1 hypothetical protein AN218_25340 [Streptomyces nanshensis]
MSRTTPVTPYSIRTRIGRDASSGFYAVPHRYRLHLSLSCPDCLRIAITHALLRLDDILPLTLLPEHPDDDGRAALQQMYEATRHGSGRPATVPALSDSWTGRIVSNHAPDILRDLATWFRGPGAVDLHPAHAESESGILTRMLDEEITAAVQPACRGERVDGERLETLFAALDDLEARLAVRPYLLGKSLTAADVHLWVTLLELDTVHRPHLDASAVRRIAARRRLWEYARRLCDQPAFHRHLRAEEVARRHGRRCRGAEPAGGEGQFGEGRFIDWTSSRAAV